MQGTLVQKILQKHTAEEVTTAGQIIQCQLDGVLANDITAPLAIASFYGMGAKKVFDPEKIFLVMDHFTPQKDIDSANQVLISRNFAKEQNLKHYYEGGDCGVEHSLLPELGLVQPLNLIIGADSHTCTYGGLGAFATGMGSTDIAAGMALGETWLKVPASIQVNFTGQMDSYLRAKDLILLLIKTIGVDGALYKALEFTGPVIASLPLEGRLTMANMAIEAGGKAGLFPVDALTKTWAAEHNGKKDLEDLQPDANANYERVVTIDLNGQEPVVACPHIPSNVKNVSECKNISINQVVIGSCTNGRISDLRDAAKVLKGQKVAKHLRCMILPSTPNVWKQALKEGLIEIFLEAGCILGPSSCGPCLGGHLGILGNGERAIATTNRNFKGRMGSLDSEIFLASPLVAAASAITGEITHPKLIK